MKCAKCGHEDHDTVDGEVYVAMRRLAEDLLDGIEGRPWNIIDKYGNGRMYQLIDRARSLLSAAAKTEP